MLPKNFIHQNKVKLNDETLAQSWQILKEQKKQRKKAGSHIWRLRQRISACDCIAPIAKNADDMLLHLVNVTYARLAALITGASRIFGTSLSSVNIAKRILIH